MTDARCVGSSLATAQKPMLVTNSLHGLLIVTSALNSNRLDITVPVVVGAGERSAQAAPSSSLAKLREYLAGGGDQNATNEQGKTLLMQAAYERDLAAAALLVERGAEVNRGSRLEHGSWWTPLKIALDSSGVYPASGLLKAWPESGPELLWKYPLGPGYSSVCVAGGKVYATGGGGGRADHDAEREFLRFLLCLDAATGKHLWEIREPASGGSEQTITPVYSDGYSLWDRAGRARWDRRPRGCWCGP